MIEIDARGRACPEPVILLRRAVRSSPDRACILVDDEAAVENITRFARNSGYCVNREDVGQGTRLTLAR